MNIKFFALEYHLADHCNLNCAGCSHFSPIAEPRFASLDRFEENLRKLKEWNFEIGQFNLLGGEPLLHPQIRDFILITKKYLFNTRIVIKTNGILLTDDFIKFCETIGVNISYTRYIKSSLNTNKFNNTFFEDKFVMNFMYNYISDIPLKKDYRCFLKNKASNNFCSQLEENGDLHFCGFSANIKHYNIYYKKTIPVIKHKDYFNIYEDNNLFDIWKGLNGKRPFCEYCCLPTKKQWHLFNSNENEWMCV